MTQDEINRVAQTLDQYYVYALCNKNDGTPFYIGKGHGDRVFNHEASALLEEESILTDDSLTQEDKNLKISQLTNKIKTILKEEDGDPIKVIIKWGLSEQEAFMCESSLINMLGYMGKKKVCCGELTNIVNGHASKQEKESVADVKTRAREVGEFLNECAIPERDISGIKQNVAFIKINQLYHKCIDEKGNVNDYNIKECTRGCWPIGKDKIAKDKNNKCKIDYIFALYRRRVVGIYHVTGVPYVTDLTKFPSFPPDEREMDRWKSIYSKLEDAKGVLSEKDYLHFEEQLKKEVKTANENGSQRVTEPNDILKLWRHRVYFLVDDDVPTDLHKYKNTLLTKGGSGDFFKSRRSVLYHFGRGNVK